MCELSCAASLLPEFVSLPSAEDWICVPCTLGTSSSSAWQEHRAEGNLCG